MGDLECAMSWASPIQPWRQSMSELPPEATPGLWQWGRAEPSDGLVVLPQSGLQEFVRQVVSGDDPNNLGELTWLPL